VEGLQGDRSGHHSENKDPPVQERSVLLLTILG